jgi:FkbM family methyltransferase
MRLTGEPPLQLVRIRDNSFGYADMSDGFLRLIVIEQGFERDFFEIADALLADGGVFIDGGANHGLLSFGLAGRHGEKIDFHLFEPNPKMVASIEKTAALYPAMRLTLNEAALTEADGSISFAIVHDQSGQSHITEAGGVTVPSVALDTYLKTHGLASVQLLKLDIEGYELAALRGARRSLESRAIQAVYFEYFEKFLTRVGPPEDLIRYLDEVGFEVCFSRPCDFNPRGGPTHVHSGLPMLPVAGHSRPPMTDLMAVPKERLTPCS